MVGDSGIGYLAGSVGGKSSRSLDLEVRGILPYRLCEKCQIVPSEAARTSWRALPLTAVFLGRMRHPGLASACPNCEVAKPSGLKPAQTSEAPTVFSQRRVSQLSSDSGDADQLGDHLSHLFPRPRALRCVAPGETSAGYKTPSSLKG